MPFPLWLVESLGLLPTFLYGSTDHLIACMFLELKFLEAPLIGYGFSAALDLLLRFSWHLTLVQVEVVPQAAFLGFLSAYSRALLGHLYALLLRTLVSAADFSCSHFCTNRCLLGHNA